MNKIVLTGRLTKDIELRYTTDNRAVANFDVAVQRERKDVADFFSCVSWSGTAEAMNKYLHKGDKILIEGRVEIDSYEKDGQKKYKTQIICEKVEFIDVKKPLENLTNSQVIQEVMKDDPFKEFGDEVIITDDDMPF